MQDLVRKIINTSLAKEKEAIVESFCNEFKKYGIETKLAICHFFAQIMHESGDLKSREENLNYKRESLLKNFSKYFNEINVDKYIGNPALIASRIYGNRMGNGSEESQEGYLYRGRGFMQLTGKNNYELFGIFLGDKSLFIKSPALVSEVKYSVLSAIWFWNSRKLTFLANSDENSKLIDITYKDEVYKNINKAVADISKLVNGGYHGIADRNNRFLKYSTF